MMRLPKAQYALVLLILIVALTGCELRRTGDASSDLEPVSELPPTLAPLGADSGEIAGEATPIPTVINVQPTATESELGAGEAAESPLETVAPTVQAIDLSTAPEANNDQAEEAAVSPETFAAPVDETEPEAPLVVDAPTSDTGLPDGGPIASNPPTSGQSPEGGSTAYGGVNYVVQPGDTLFSIGLRYGVTPQAIMAANGLSSELIVVGQQLTIPVGDDVGQIGPPGVPGAGGVTHLVAPGETLYRIAMQYGVLPEAIAAANGLTPPFIIQVGQELVIPVLDGAPGVNPYPAPGYGYGAPPDDGYNYPQPPDGYGYYPQPEHPGQGYGYPPQMPPQQDGYGYYPQPQQPDGGYGYYPPQNPQNPQGYPPPGGARTHVVTPGETLFSIAQRYGVPVDVLAAVNGLANPNQIYVGQVLYLP